tara:strand:- start:169 stop:507 length:339 start_codon:yes stop_codon:yes gene_type:complete
MRKFSKIYKEDQYFEAKIQLRPFDEEMVAFVEKRIEKRDNVFITKVDKKKFGIDFYLNNSKFARILGKKLTKAFKGVLKTSVQLHTRNRQTSKDVYRVTVCFRREYPESEDL